MASKQEERDMILDLAAAGILRERSPCSLAWPNGPSGAGWRTRAARRSCLTGETWPGPPIGKPY